MTLRPLPPGNPPPRPLLPCTWLVCESRDRWQRAIERFAPALLPHGCECLPATAGEVRARAVHTPLLVVLYELSPAEPREALRSIALCAARRNPPLQMVALDPRFLIGSAAEVRLAGELRALGAAAVLRHPEQLPLLGRLVARHVARRSAAVGGDFANRPEFPTLPG